MIGFSNILTNHSALNKHSLILGWKFLYTIGSQGRFVVNDRRQIIREYILRRSRTKSHVDKKQTHLKTVAIIISTAKRKSVFKLSSSLSSVIISNGTPLTSCCTKVFFLCGAVVQNYFICEEKERVGSVDSSAPPILTPRVRSQACHLCFHRFIKIC